MKTAVIIKHDHETNWLVMKYLDNHVVGEDWCSSESEANTAKTNWIE